MTVYGTFATRIALATKALAYVDVQRLSEGVIEPDYIIWRRKQCKMHSDSAFRVSMLRSI